jgi:formamidopyrimidine-DNA glycosylase
MIKGKKLHELRPLSGKLSRQMQPIRFDLNVDDVLVKGKSIFVQLEDGREIFSSLGMSGWWYPEPDQVDEEMNVYHQGKLIRASAVVASSMKHKRVELVVDGPSAFYVDPRNFGNMKLLDKSAAEKLRAGLGVELLKPNSAVNGMAAVAALRAQGKREIGEVLLDQSVLCGLGNIYRAETLYISRINPFRMTSSLSAEELARIVIVAAQVLNISYHLNGTLVYPMKFLEEHMDRQIHPTHDRVMGPMVYGRGQDLFGNPVNRSSSAGRTLWWVPSIQI